MERHHLSTSTVSALESSNKRTDRATLDPAAWIRWKERLSVHLENYGASIDDASYDQLRGYFERHLSPSVAAAKIAGREAA